MCVCVSVTCVCVSVSVTCVCVCPSRVCVCVCPSRVCVCVSVCCLCVCVCICVSSLLSLSPGFYRLQFEKRVFIYTASDKSLGRPGYKANCPLQQPERMLGVCERRSLIFPGFYRLQYEKRDKERGDIHEPL